MRALSIIILLVAVVSIIFSLTVGVKFVKTTYHLDRITTEISNLNYEAQNAAPGYGWNEERTQRYNELQAERKKLYNSNDLVVNWFANQNNWMQVGVLFLSLLVFLTGIACCAILCMRWYNILKHILLKNN